MDIGSGSRPLPGAESQEVNQMTVLSMHLLLFVSLVASMPVAGQDLSSFVAKARSIVEAEHPDWKFHEPHKVIGEDPRQVLCGWGTRESGATLQIFYGASTQEAVERMQFIKKIASVGVGQRLEGLGDEAYRSKAANSDAGVVRFRKSNVFIDIAASSVDIAEEIARKIAELVPDK